MIGSMRPKIPALAARLVGGAMLLVLLASRPGLAADSPKGTVEAARVALEEQRYDDARALVHDELARPETARRAPALEVMAISYLLEGKEAEAMPFLRALYELAPAFQLSDPSLPPRVMQPFSEEAARPHVASVAIVTRPGEDGSDYVLEVSRPIDRVAMSCRTGGSGPFAAVSLGSVGPRRYRFKLPTASVHACFATASDADGLPMGRLGTADSPVELRAALPAAKRGLFAQWWFWTIVGAAVAGGTAAIYAETRPVDVQPQVAKTDVTLGPQSR